MNPYIILAAVLAFGASVSAAEWHGHHRGAAEVQAKWDAEVAQKTIAAAKVENNHQAGTIGVLNNAAATKPDVAADGVVAERLRNAFTPADCPRLPKPAQPGPAVGPPGAVAAVDAGTDAKLRQSAAEVKACVELAHDYDTLRALWHANESPAAKAQETTP